MKLKPLAMTIVAGGLFAAAGPSSAVLCSAVPTLSAWSALGAAGCVDPDSDSTWVFGSVTGAVPLTTSFTLTELEFAGGDVYNVAFSFAPPLTTAAGQGWAISYTATSNATQMFTAANYDTGVTEPVNGSGAVSTAHVTGTGLNLTLTSTDGSHAPPPSGETPFAGLLNIAVTDTFVTIPAGIVYNSANNSFQTGTPARAPEPISLALVGVALAGMGLVRRKRKLT